MFGQKKKKYKKVKYVNWKEVLIAVLILLVLLRFWDSKPVQPLRMFVVFNHEVSHGLAAVATSGSIVKFGLAYDNTSEGGYAETEGGSKLLIFNAGYLGSILFGGILLWLSNREKLAKLFLFLIALYLLFISIWFVRTVDGMVYGVVFAGALLLMVAVAPKFLNYLSFRILALSSCLFALIDIVTDFGGGGKNDAMQLQQLTMVPAMFWWIAWILIASYVVYRLFIISFKKEEVD